MWVTLLPSEENVTCNCIFSLSARYWLMPWYKGTQPYCTVTAGTAGCSTKGLSVTVLLQLVQQAAVPRDSVLLYCYSWYSRLQ